MTESSRLPSNADPGPLQGLDVRESPYHDDLLERYPAEVVEVICIVVDELLQIRSTDVQFLGDPTSAEATEAYLSEVREQFGVAYEHDAAVRRRLEALASESSISPPADAFAAAPVMVMLSSGVVLPSGESLTDLVEAEEYRLAERALVSGAYVYLARDRR